MYPRVASLACVCVIDDVKNVFGEVVEQRFMIGMRADEMTWQQSLPVHRSRKCSPSADMDVHFPDGGWFCYDYSVRAKAGI